jgi:hypothetical protein
MYLHLYLNFPQFVLYTGVYSDQINLIYSKKIYFQSPIHPNTLSSFHTSTQSKKHHFKHPLIHPSNQPSIQSSIYSFNIPYEQLSIHSLTHQNIYPSIYSLIHLITHSYILPFSYHPSTQSPSTQSTTHSITY